MNTSVCDALGWIVALFDEHGVPYQLVGGLAARAYGARRPIADIDFYVSAEGMERIRSELEPFLARPPAHHEDEDWSLTFARLEYAGQIIELGIAEGARLRDRAAGTWEDARVDLRSSERKRLCGVEVKVMPLARLIAYKQKLARDVDIRDLEEIAGAERELRDQADRAPAGPELI